MGLAPCVACQQNRLIAPDQRRGKHVPSWHRHVPPPRSPGSSSAPGRHQPRGLVQSLPPTGAGRLFLEFKSSQSPAKVASGVAEARAARGPRSMRSGRPRGIAGWSDGARSRARRAGHVVDRGHPIERLLHGAHHAVVVGQHAPGADEEAVAAGQFQVEDRLGLLGLHRGDGGDAARPFAAGLPA